MNNKVFGADPYVFRDPTSGLFYCVATRDEGHLHFVIYESKDLLNWKQVGYALDDRDKNNWCSDWFWAPECYYNPNNGYYYLFYSAKTLPTLVEKYFVNPNYEECCKIGVAVAKSPKGPFKNIINLPLDYYPYDPNYSNVDACFSDIFKLRESQADNPLVPKGEYLSSIDVNLFIDGDKKIYLYFSRCCYHNAVFDERLHKYIEESNICVVELDNKWWFSKEPIMPTIKDEYKNECKGKRQDRFKTVISYQNEPQEWENAHVNDYELYNAKKHNRRWSEGSTTATVILKNVKYYVIIYSCNNYENEKYGVGIAFSTSPLGPFKKYPQNPIISEKNDQNVVSTGHGCLINLGSELYYFHHGRNSSNEDRSLFLSRIKTLDLNNVSIDKIVQCKLN